MIDFNSGSYMKPCKRDFLLLNVGFGCQQHVPAGEEWTITDIYVKTSKIDLENAIIIKAGTDEYTFPLCKFAWHLLAFLDDVLHYALEDEEVIHVLSNQIFMFDFINKKHHGFIVGRKYIAS